MIFVNQIFTWVLYLWIFRTRQQLQNFNSFWKTQIIMDFLSLFQGLRCYFNDNPWNQFVAENLSILLDLCWGGICCWHLRMRGQGLTTCRATPSVSSPSMFLLLVKIRYKCFNLRDLINLLLQGVDRRHWSWEKLLILLQLLSPIRWGNDKVISHWQCIW